MLRRKDVYRAGISYGEISAQSFHLFFLAPAIISDGSSKTFHHLPSAHIYARHLVRTNMRQAHWKFGHVLVFVVVIAVACLNVHFLRVLF